MPRTARCMIVALALLTLAGPLTARLAIRPAAAQIRNGAGGNSAASSVVGCIRAGEDMGRAPADAPQLATTCFTSLLHYDRYQDSDGTLGDAPPGDAALVRFGDSKPDSRLEPIPVAGAQVQEVGAAYGLAHATGRNPAAAGTPGADERLFVAAYTKRGTRFGPLGPGGIYTYAERYRDSNADPRTVRPFVFVPNAAPGPSAPPHYAGDGSAVTFPDGTNAATYSIGRGGVHTPFSVSSGWDEADSIAVAYVGRTGLGDIELDPDERFLYAVNLRDKHIYRFDTWSSDPQHTLARLPAFPNLLEGSACGASTDAQPFALHVTRAWLYLGVTCTAASTQNPAGLAVRVWRYDRSGNAWDTTPALTFDLAGYAAQRNSGTGRSMGWRPWTSAVPCGSSVGGHALCPQPLLTDIEIDEGGAMILGLRDRFGDLTGMEPLRRSIPAGDIMRAAPDPASPGRWLAPDPAPAAEFFDDRHTIEGSLEDKAEVAGGGLAYLPGSRSGARSGAAGEVATTWLDPYEGSSFGAAWFDTGAPGRPTAREQVYPSSAALRYFGKAAGLGDVELLCAWAALGDRVWDDADADGLQDAGERGLGGVQVQLFDASDAGFTRPLATVTTGDVDGDGVGGEYRFYVEPWRRYTVRLEPSQFNRSSGALRGWTATRPNRGGDDTRDSDADPLTRAVTDLTPLGDGEQNITADIGLTRAPGTGQLGDRVWVDADGDGAQESGEPGLGGVPVQLSACDDDARLSCDGWRLVAETQTDNTGRYAFAQLAPDRYRLTFALPAGYQFTRPDAADDASDSDILPGRDWIGPVAVGWDQRDDSRDAGLLPALGDASVRIDGPREVLQGQPADYTVTVTGGTAPMPNVPLSVALPVGALSASGPGAALGGSVVSGLTLAWTIPLLAAGKTETRTFRAVYRDLDDELIGATIWPAPPDADASNNSHAARTLVVSPNVAITQVRRERAAPGEAFAYQLAISNQHSQPSGAVPPPFLAATGDLTVVNTLPAGVVYDGFSSSGVAELVGDSGPSTGPRTLTWRIPPLAAGGAQTIDVQVRVRVTAPLPEALVNQASVSTGALTTPADGQADNTAVQTTAVSYPDLAVDLDVDGGDGPAVRGEGSTLVYSVRYQNLGGLVAAEAATLTLTLPREVTAGSPSNAAFVSGVAPDGRPALTWSLGTLAAASPGDTISVPATINPGAAAAAPLLAEAAIGTVTPEIALGNNRDSFRLNVIAPPTIPDVRGGDMRLAIHSTLDPQARTGDAVYVSDGAGIAWPAGEVLDFTPLVALDLPELSDDERAFYIVRAAVRGWRLLSFTGPAGTTEAAGGDGDVFGRAGCRGGAIAHGAAEGCGYRYLGDPAATSDDAAPPAFSPPAQADMAGQAHAYWSATPPAAMRADVYTMSAPGLPGVRLTLEVLVDIDVAARETGVAVRPAESQRLRQTYGVRLVAPRSTK